MRKIAVLLTTCTLLASAVHGQVQSESDTFVDRQQFVEGFQAGALAGLGVEFLRHHVLPSLDSWKLYDTYGICRDQLTGQAKVAAALILAAYLNDAPTQVDVKKLSSKLLGVLTGTSTASVVSKIVAHLLK